MRSDGMVNFIPIQNIYYMLCYAWNVLKYQDIVEVDSLYSNKIMDLFALILENGVSYLIRRGLYRQYITFVEEENIIRGKININKSFKRNLWIKRKMFCEYDELNHNILHNRIIKTTINYLLLYEDLDTGLKNDLKKVHKYFEAIDTIKLNKRIFREVQIHRNNRYYSFILDICELIFNNLLVDEKSGTVKFKDFIRDERQMRYLFENFVRNFYKKELANVRIYRENIKWDVKDGAGMEYLPIMQTDISLEIKDKKLIIDTKYKISAFSYNYNAKKLHSENLYQLFSYIKNIQGKGGIDEKCIGILLYPRTGEDLDLEYLIQGQIIRIKTINLGLEWRQIHKRLTEIAME